MKLFLIILLAVISPSVCSIVQQILKTNKVDTRADTNLGTKVDGKYILGVQVDNLTDLDVSTQRASELFDTMYSKWKSDSYPSFIKTTFFHMQDGEENMKMVETWELYVTKNLVGSHDNNIEGVGSNGTSIGFKVILKTEDKNNTENNEHHQTIDFKCKHYEILNSSICMPIECNLEPFTPVPTPAIRCATNYSQSQELVQVVFDSRATQKQEPADKDIYNLVLECIRAKTEKTKLVGNEVCYYAGFEPNNIVSLEEMTKTMKQDNWVASNDGGTEFERVTETDRKSLDVDVNTVKAAITQNDPK